MKNNWLKFAILFIVLVAIGFATYFYMNQTGEQTLKTQLLLQEQCANASKKFFNEDKWGRAAEDLSSSNVNYTNYYNSKYNKCFILITERFSDGSGTSEILYDVFGHKEYANGAFGTNDYSFKKSYCTILNDECKSITDFNQFVSEYIKG